MADRRTLAEALNKATPAPIDPEREQKFVTAAKAQSNPLGATVVPPMSVTAVINRSPFSTRLRTDFAAALKRASLERQLAGREPNSVQEILEEALETWLRTNGSL